MSQGRWVPIPALAFVTFPTPTQRDRRGRRSLQGVLHNPTPTQMDRRGRRSLKTDGLHVRGQSRTPVPTYGRFTYPRTVEDAGPYRAYCIIRRQRKWTVGDADPYIQTIFASKKAERVRALQYRYSTNQQKSRMIFPFSSGVVYLGQVQFSKHQAAPSASFQIVIPLSSTAGLQLPHSA